MRMFVTNAITGVIFSLDFEKLRQWQDFAWKTGGGDFWSRVFNDERSKEAIKEMTRMFSPETKFPKTDIYMTDTDIVVVMEIPGVRKEDIQLGVQGDRLAVQGVVNSPHATLTAVSKERSYGSFERVIQLPEITGKENTSARFENGLLEVRLPRSHQAHTKRINIE